MKRILSLFLAVLMSFSFLSVSANTIYAAEKMHVEDALLELEKKQGYIPGKNSAVQYNCFAFVSDVCEKLFGVTYYYEQQIDNYQFKHTKDYYTVSKITFPYSSDISKQREYAKSIRDWLLANAAAGDILQYGSASSTYSKRHTVLIQHIDEKKMQVLHSNYETQNIPASACRLDTVIFDNFISNPLNNDYDSYGNIKSMNLLLGSQLKLTQGCGMSLNRFTSLEKNFYLDKSVSSVVKINKTERASCTSIKLYWNSIPNASAYSVDYKLSTATKWKNASKSVTTNSYVVEGLKTGKEYSFRVRANIDSVWQDYSAEVKKTALPPKPANITITADQNGISLNWASRSDITGVLLFRGESETGEYKQLADLVGENVKAYFDKSVKPNKNYYYKIQRYLVSGGTTYYSEMSPIFSACVELPVPQNVTAVSKSKGSMNVSWDKSQNARKYIISYTEKGKSEYTKITTKNTSKTITGLKVGQKYKIKVRAVNDLGGTANSKIVYCTIKPKTPKISVTASNGKAKVSWEKKEEVSGYVIYRSYSKNGKYELVKTIKGNKTFSYTDSKTYKNNKYFYKVKSYVNREGKPYYSDASAVKSVKIR